MFYTYAEKQGNGFFGGWQTRQVAFDTLRRYLYYSEPVKSAFSIGPETAPPATRTVAPAHVPSTVGASRTVSVAAGAPPPATTAPVPSAGAAGGVSEVAVSPSTVVWRTKVKVSAVVPLATLPDFHPHRCASECDLYQLEIQGESRPMVRGETPPAGPLLCPAADLSQLERSRCTEGNDAYIADPFFLKELFDSLRDQFEGLTQERLRVAAASSAAEDGASGGGDGGASVGAGVQTLVSPRGAKGERLLQGTPAPVRLTLRSRDEREFRRLWYVLQLVLGYDKLIVRPYRGLPPYDPRNGVAFAHIPMSVWHTFQSLDKAVFYTFTRGNVYALEEREEGEAPSSSLPPAAPQQPALSSPAASVSSPSTAAGASRLPSRVGDGERVPRLKLILAGAYLCITHDSVLCMRETGSIPRWLRLAEVQEFHWSMAAHDGVTGAPSPFCVFLSDPPIPDLFFEPLPPATGTDAIAAHSPLVDVRRLAHVIHDSCFASLSTRRVIRMKEVSDASMEEYVARAVRERQRRPTVQRGAGYNTTLSCPLPKEQLAVVWQQVQAELLERGNMASRAAIPIYASNARDVELSEDQLSTVERELDEERERRDDIVGMPLERARLLERRERAEVTAAVAQRSRPRTRHRDAATGVGRDVAASAATLVLPLTMELLQTPQIQGRFAAETAHGSTEPLDNRHATARQHSTANSDSGSESTVLASEYSSYLVPGARYLSPEEWLSGAYGSPTSPHTADAPFDTERRHASATPAVRRTGHVTEKRSCASAPPPSYRDERTLNEIIDRSMAALDGGRADLLDSAP
ncbi:hypothetical protein NESM_000215900 [Novymonas esmeraldas]|uniref:Uncharacterized protein n=1 Tax=Novymonas esmeraldas TaxID=1808958 RepID=A0AAW0F4N3_9TRYP